MSLRPIKRLIIVGGVLLLSIGVARAQTPSPDAMAAARELVTTLKLSDQYKALLPVILLGLKPALTQDRPEIERDYEAMLPAVADAYTPYYDAMVDSIATVYANTFSVEELRQIELFWALLASGQINMRKVDGWQTLATKPSDQPIDLAA
jgi:uncharacterized protein